MKIIRYDQPQFKSLFSEFFHLMKWQPHDYMPYYIKWWKDDFSSKGYQFEDKSFLLIDNDIVVCVFLGTIEIKPDKTKILSYYGNSTVCFFNSINNRKYNKNINKIVKNELNTLLDLVDKNIKYRDYLLNGTIDSVTNTLLSKGASHDLIFLSTINLMRDSSVIRSDIRKSYKALINWGDKNLKIEIFDKNNITQSNIQEFRELHIQESERETRTLDNWLIQYDMIKNNEAFLVVGYLEDTLVSAGFFNYSPTVCNYGSSASIRDLFDKPLFHGVMWKAILHAKSIGCNDFEVGERHFQNKNDSHFSKKELDISYFKAGFSGEVKAYLEVNNMH